MLLFAPTAVAAENGEQAPVRTILDGALTLNGIFTILSVIGAAMAIIGYFERKRRQTERDAQEREDRVIAAMRERNDEIKDELRDLRVSLGERLKAVETSIQDFMPRAEIEGKIEHEKNNRVAGDDAAARMLQRHEDTIATLRVDVGRLAERQGGITSEVAEIKVMLRDGLREQASKIDKMSDAISHIGERR